MLKEMIFSDLYSSGAFYGGSFGNLLAQWEQMGVFTYLLPFLLLFAFIFGITMNLFKDNKMISAIIAVSVALMALQFGVVSVFFSDIFPRLGVALAIILCFVILIGLFGDKNNRALHNFLMWGAVAIAGIIVIQSLNVFRVNYYNTVLGFIPVSWIPWIAVVVILGLIVGASRPRQTTTQTVESMLSRWFGEK
jgi:hypothetical protein